MFGRCNICVEPRQRIAVPPECQFRRPAEKRDQLIRPGPYWRPKRTLEALDDASSAA
jgi:hypothetical protein